LIIFAKYKFKYGAESAGFFVAQPSCEQMLQHKAVALNPQPCVAPSIPFKIKIFNC